MARIEEIPDSPRQPQTEKKRGPSALVKYYLVAYNVVSAVGWLYILVCTLVHVFALDDKYPQLKAIPYFPPRPAHAQALLRSRSRFPEWALQLEEYLPKDWLPVFYHTATTYERIGWQTTVVQTFAILEVVHSLFGWVRSPLGTVLMQVASRYFSVWGITYIFSNTHYNPLYTSMILSWSITEVIRYVYYALNLLGREPYALLYIRYTTFYVLYLTGASSEAFLMFSTLPDLHQTPLVSWSAGEWFRLAMFCMWWPALYVLYTHMIKQRRKALSFQGPGKTLGAKPKTL